MVCSPPRNKTNWRGWEEASKEGKIARRLEPEGETEVPEIIIVSDAVESTFVDLDGKSRRELEQNSLEERERCTRPRGRGDRKSEKKSNSSGITRNARLREEREKCRGGG